MLVCWCVYVCARATYAADAASEILVVLVVTGGINQEKACNTAHRFGITVFDRYPPLWIADSELPSPQAIIATAHRFGITVFDRYPPLWIADSELPSPQAIIARKEIKELLATKVPAYCEPCVYGELAVALGLRTRHRGLNESLSATSRPDISRPARFFGQVSAQKQGRAGECKEKVLMDTMPNSSGFSRENVTLVTVASLDRCVASLYQAAHWDGAVSVVYHARNTEEHAAIAAFVREALAPLCGRRGQAVRASVVLGRSEVDGVEEFPINVLRSCAVAAARTEFVLFVDADFIPSTGAKHMITNFYFTDAYHRSSAGSPSSSSAGSTDDAEKSRDQEDAKTRHSSRNHNKYLEDSKTGLADTTENTSDGSERDHTLLVLPCFYATRQVENSNCPEVIVPRGGWPTPQLEQSSEGNLHVAVQDMSRERLLSELRGAASQAAHERQSHAGGGHGPTDYARWLMQSSEALPYRVKYAVWYEPYFVINKTAWRGSNRNGLFDVGVTYRNSDKV